MKRGLIVGKIKRGLIVGRFQPNACSRLQSALPAAGLTNGVFR